MVQKRRRGGRWVVEGLWQSDSQRPRRRRRTLEGFTLTWTLKRQRQKQKASRKVKVSHYEEGDDPGNKQTGRWVVVWWSQWSNQGIEEGVSACMQVK